MNRKRTGLSHDAANDSAGSWESDDAIGFDPFPLLYALASYGAPVAVIGQVAGIMHGSVDLTGDLDLLWDGNASRAGAIAAAFTALDAEITDDEGSPLTCEAAAFLQPKILFRTSTASGDCCTTRLPWGELDIHGIIDRCEVALGANGLAIRYVTVADLIAMRLAVGRPKDILRASELLSLQASAQER